MIVSLDFETRSPVNLKKCGPRRYAAEAEVICMAYAIDGGDPVLWLPGDPFPDELRDAGEFHAWNAGFERAIWHGVCCRLYGWPECPPARVWVDTQAKAALAGLPLALGYCAQALGLPADKQKDKRGTYLIRRLCAPGRDGTYCEDPDLLREMYAYCLQDVVTETTLAAGLPPIPWRERRIWSLTEEMNAAGVPVDLPAAEGAAAYAERAAAALSSEAAELAGDAFSSVTQVARVLVWIRNRGLEIDNLQKGTVEAVLADPNTPEDVATVLSARLAAGLASVKKYAAAIMRAGQDGRVRDTLRYHGAGTGRWSSVGLQVQNIKRPRLSPAEVDRILRTLADRQTVPGRPYRAGLDVLSDCVRGMIRAEPGHVLVASDYSQIELRVLLWLAEDEHNLQELRDGLDPYKTMAVEVFGGDYETVKPEDRQTGKSAVLGCGFQLGAAGFREYATGYGVELTEDEAELIVQAYRSKYARVKSFWYDLQDAAFAAINNPGRIYRCRRVLARVYKSGRFLELRLPSGRPLRYYRPSIVQAEKPWGVVDQIEFYGLDTYSRRWGRTHTYGGKLVENVTQATARDIMAGGMLRADAAGLSPVMTVHDEVVCHPEAEYPDPLDTLNACLLKKPTWAAGIPLAVEGWTGERYRK